VDIDVLPLGNIIVIRPAGRLDNTTSAEFQTRLLQETTAGRDLIVDLATVEYISSGGLRALINAAKQKPANCRLGVTGLHAIVREVFYIAHCEELIPTFGSLDEARGAWRKPDQPTAGPGKSR
jgi:anti-anti-sigma factor